MTRLLPPKSVWQHLTLMPLSDPSNPLWHSTYLTRLSGLLSSWQRDNWLLRQAHGIAVALVLLLVAVAPFTSTTMIGLILLACSAAWL
ncbi:MAG: hypothetical protein WBA10_19810, partial [Elainellaceae cyanobacterium]